MMRSGPRAVLVVAVAAAALLPALALAEGVEAKKQEAKRLRDRGTEAFDAKEYAAALSTAATRP
jgi:hypothetical protein